MILTSYLKIEKCMEASKRKKIIFNHRFSKMKKKSNRVYKRCAIQIMPLSHQSTTTLATSKFHGYRCSKNHSLTRQAVIYCMV